MVYRPSISSTLGDRCVQAYERTGYYSRSDIVLRDIETGSTYRHIYMLASERMDNNPLPLSHHQDDIRTEMGSSVMFRKGGGGGWEVKSPDSVSE